MGQDSEADLEEKRRADRAAIELRVEYKRLNTFLADYTKNISRGGTFIATERPLPIGTEFVFALGIPHMDEPLRLRGKVMWITAAADSSKANPAGMGIEFLYRNDEERAMLEAQVERLIKDQLGDRLAGRLLGKNEPE